MANDRRFPTPDDMLETFNDYISSINDHNEEVYEFNKEAGGRIKDIKIPTKTGFFLHARISRQTFYNYKERYEGEYDDVQDYIITYLEEVLVQRGLNNPKASTFDMFMLKSQFKYNDKPSDITNVQIHGSVNYHSMNIEDLEKKRQLFLKNREKEG